MSILFDHEKQKQFASFGVEYLDRSQAAYLKLAELLAYGIADGVEEVPYDTPLIKEGALISAFNELFKYPVMISAGLAEIVDQALKRLSFAEPSTYAYDLMFAAKSGLEVAVGHMIGGLEINGKLRTIYSAMIPTSDEVFASTGQEWIVLFCLAKEAFAMLDLEENEKRQGSEYAGYSAYQQNGGAEDYWTWTAKQAMIAA